MHAAQSNRSAWLVCWDTLSVQSVGVGLAGLLPEMLLGVASSLGKCLFRWTRGLC